MNITGVIIEHNPLHNGHIYHLQKAKEMTNADLVIGVISGNYNQRGDLSIIDKFEKTRNALNYGIDLVVELPYISTTQNAYIFGSTAVKILNDLDIDNLVFGSESGNLEELSKYAELEVDVTRLKELMHDGNSYPKAYGLLSGSMYPNDILAVTYLKAIKGTNIKPFVVKRTNDYNGLDLNTISSATAIRNAIKNNKDYKMATPLVIDNPIFIDSLYPYLRNILLTTPKEELSKIHLVSEGIENLMIKNAYRFDKYDDFLQATISKRYTKSRVQRILCQIACHISKDEANKCERDYIRVLGFNTKGKEYLNSIKKNEDLKLVTQFKNLPENAKNIEWKASVIYAGLTKDPNGYLKKELKGPVIKKD